MIVVKVGGSLFDHPNLGPGLRQWLAGFGDTETVFVAGGGAAADAVRQYDAAHGLGDSAAHYLAILSMGVTAEFLKVLLFRPSHWAPHPDRPLPEFDTRDKTVLNPVEFLREDQRKPGGLPHSWAVTSDSIAARAAHVWKADRLILLKSLDIPPGTLWPVAAANGWVDDYFPTAVADAPFAVEAVNFRSYLDAFTPPR